MPIGRDGAGLEVGGVRERGDVDDRVLLAVALDPGLGGLAGLAGIVLGVGEQLGLPSAPSPTWTISQSPSCLPNPNRFLGL